MSQANTALPAPIHVPSISVMPSPAAAPNITLQKQAAYAQSQATEIQEEDVNELLPPLPLDAQLAVNVANMAATQQNYTLKPADSVSDTLSHSGHSARWSAVHDTPIKSLYVSLVKSSAEPECTVAITSPVGTLLYTVEKKSAEPASDGGIQVWEGAQSPGSAHKSFQAKFLNAISGKEEHISVMLHESASALSVMQGTHKVVHMVKKRGFPGVPYFGVSVTAGFDMILALSLVVSLIDDLPSMSDNERRFSSAMSFMGDKLKDAGGDKLAGTVIGGLAETVLGGIAAAGEVAAAGTAGATEKKGLKGMLKSASKLIRGGSSKTGGRPSISKPLDSSVQVASEPIARPPSPLAV
jgi:hypothetical protein